MENGLFGLFLEWLRNNPGTERFMQQEKKREERQRLANIANLNTLSNAPEDPRLAYLNGQTDVNFDALGAVNQIDPRFATAMAPIDRRYVSKPEPAYDRLLAEANGDPVNYNVVGATDDLVGSVPAPSDMAPARQASHPIYPSPSEIASYPDTIEFTQTGDGVAEEVDARNRGVPPIPEGLILGNPALEQRAAKLAAAKNSADVMQEIVNLTTPKPKARAKTRAKTAPVQTRIKNEPRRVANQIYEKAL
jgi:hypothetical protein